LASSIFSTELSADSFARLLAWLDDEPERAAEIYEKMRFRLTAFFTARRCFYADDLVDTVFDRVAETVEDREFSNKPAFMLGVARNVYLEYVRKEPLTHEIDELRLSDKPDPDDIFDVNAVRSKLDGCLGELPDEDCDLVIEYMSERGPEKIKGHTEMSRRLGVSIEALRTRIMRIKRQLRNCLEECSA